MKRIKEEQLKDKELSSVINCTLNGWGPALGIPIEISSKYWAARSHLSVVDGTLLVFDDRIAIPCNLRKDMLTRIHTDGHLNLSKSQKRAQVSIWWPELSADLKGWDEGCSFCQRHSHQLRAEPLKPTLLLENLGKNLVGTCVITKVKIS